MKHAMLLAIALGAAAGIGIAATTGPVQPDPAYCSRRDADPEKCVIQDGPPLQPIVRKKPPVPPRPAETGKPTVNPEPAAGAAPRQPEPAAIRRQ